VTAGHVSAAALTAASTNSTGTPRRRHCREDEYVGFVRGQGIHPSYRNDKLRHYRTFAHAWPRMTDWFAAPLVERVGRLPGETHKNPSHPVSFRARPYLLFLALRGHVTFDYAWMFGAGQIRVVDAAEELGFDLGTTELVEEAVALGYNRGSLNQAMRWTVGRIALHTGIRHASEITAEHITEALEAVRLFSERDDLHCFYPSQQNYRDNASKQWITHLHQLQVVLFHGNRHWTCRRGCNPWRSNGWPPGA
jgi:hypothetical protein